MALPSPTVAAVVAGAIPQGRQSYLWVPTVASISAPTSAELTAGTDYKNQINSVTGFAPAGTTVDFPNAGSRQIPNISGPFSLGDGTVVFNVSNTGTGDARTVFNDGTDGVSSQTTGYWYFVYEGIVSGAKMRGFQATVTSSTPTSDIASPLLLTVMFSLQNATGIIAVPTA